MTGADGAPSWLPDLAGRTVALIGGGPSANRDELTPFKDRAVFMTINNAIELAPFAAIAYGCDARWWRHVDCLPSFAGLRVTQDTELRWNPYGVHFIQSVRGRQDQDKFQTRRDRIIWGGNGGAQSLNLLAHAGPPKKICLVGFDMHVRNGKNWHGDHPWPIPALEQNVARHCRVTDRIAADLAALGVDVVNCTPGSALKNYRTSTLEREL